MLPADIFTRPRRPWQAKIQIKHLLSDDEDLLAEQINEKGKQIAAILRRCPLFQAPLIIEAFENARTMGVFNDALELMYDECDRVRIWVE